MVHCSFFMKDLAIASFKDENEMALLSDAWDPFNERNTLVETSKDVADKALNFLNPYRLVVIMNVHMFIIQLIESVIQCKNELPTFTM